MRTGQGYRGAVSTPEGFLAAEPSDHAARARWPLQLRDLVREWQAASDPGKAAALRDRTWVLLYGVVACFIRGRGRTLPSLLADLPDVAAEKALDLMRQLDSRAWNPARATPEQVRAYVALAVKHALIDLARLHDSHSLESGTHQAPEGSAAPVQDAAIDGKSYAAAIVACLSRLTARNRAAWCFRVLLEMTTDQIARHPRVCMKPGAVDVMLFRARAAMRRCLADSGVDTATMPPGTYVHLWEAIEGAES